MWFHALIVVCLLGEVWAESFSVHVERYESNFTDMEPESSSGLPIAHDYFYQRMNNRKNIEYVGRISLGTPPQKFSVIFDTGSDIFWVPKEGCSSTGPFARYCSDQTNLYSPDDSKTSKRLRKRFSIKYGTGSANGGLFSDVFSFGGPNQKNLRLKSRITFGAARVMTFSDQGILGLASIDNIPGRGTSVFHQAVKDGLMDQPIFTAFLRRCPSGGNCLRGGTITFGALDNEHCGKVEGWVNIDRGVVHWKFNIDSISAGNFHRTTFQKVISDTGTSDILVSPGVASGIARAVGAYRGNRGAYFMGCERKFKVNVEINGEDYAIPSEQLLQPVGGGRCRLLISGSNGRFWILGDPFIRTYCQVHDIKKRRIGFAKVIPGA